MDFTIKGEIRFRTERGVHWIDVTDAAGNRYGVTAAATSTMAPTVRLLEAHYLRHLTEDAPEPAPIAEPVNPPDPWVREVYELTTRFNQLTGLKVVIHDLLDVFFVTSMKDVEADERDAFKARLVERLEQLAPGWNK